MRLTNLLSPLAGEGPGEEGKTVMTFMIWGVSLVMTVIVTQQTLQRRIG
jgi:hypothetical protein